MLANNIEVSKEIINNLFQKKTYQKKIINLLERYNKKELLPTNTEITQEKIAIENMIEWLMFPSELGCKPVDLKIIDNIIIDSYCYYIFSFKNPKKPKSKPMIAVSRGYKVGEITTEGIGSDFSNFEKITDNYEEQVAEIFKTLSDL